VRYRSPDEDSGRWAGFPYRPGDIVVSTRSKSGTTWVQMICALLIFQTPDLPAPLSQLSPWLDWLVTPRDELFAQLDAQQHRRFIKTHTPLDGIPLDSQATYIVVARHPLDMAVSLYHQGKNINHGRLRRLSGGPEPSEAPAPLPSLHTWLLSWIEQDGNPREELDSLCGVMWHFSDAWQRRDDANVVLVHFDDLREDLKGEMRRLAGLLQIDVPDPTWPQLIEAARFDTMKARANQLAPNHAGILKSRQAFFRSGKSGTGRAVLSTAELDRYRERTARMAPSDLLAWLHRDPSPPARDSGT
jgi:aryl sulfotransferase